MEPSASASVHYGHEGEVGFQFMLPTGDNVETHKRRRSSTLYRYVDRLTLSLSAIMDKRADDLIGMPDDCSKTLPTRMKVRKGEAVYVVAAESVAPHIRADSRCRFSLIPSVWLLSIVSAFSPLHLEKSS
jgi:hypothetical protein